MSEDNAVENQAFIKLFIKDLALHHHHQSLNREGRWGTTNNFATSFLHFFPVLHCPLGLAELQACPFPDVVFPNLFSVCLVFFLLSLYVA